MDYLRLCEKSRQRAAQAVSEAIPRMLCGYPKATPDGQPVACGKCMCCRMTKARIKAGRFRLELLQHWCTSFWTTTYGPEHVPMSSEGRMVLEPEHATEVIEGLREALEAPRFVVVGEYGERTHRPHLHGLCFGRDPFTVERELKAIWPYGEMVQVLPAEAGAAEYVAGYAAKGLTKSAAPELEGRPPEFMRQSRSPAIGLVNIEYLASCLQKSVKDEIERTGDVPHEYYIGRDRYPMDATMLRYLRRHYGVGERSSERETRHASVPPSQADVERAKSREGRLRRKARRSRASRL